MKLVQINLGNHGSTGSIASGINEIARTEGVESFFAYPWNENNKIPKVGDIRIGTVLGYRFSRKLGKITGYNGCFSIFSTIGFLIKLDRLNPDIIHFHNLHNCYINLPMLFSYVKRKKKCVVWTLHDCWSFTGKCPYFTIADCEKWKSGCFDCPQLDRYPPANTDRTRLMWKLKKQWFTNIENMTIVTPSEWLAGLAKESFLKDYDIRVINNGIDLEVFHPTKSDFRAKMNIKNRFMILGVAFDWESRKGLDIFVNLAGRLDTVYQIVLVGTNDEVDSLLPSNIISIHRTHNQAELAEIYSAADVLLNPTLEENFPTVNIEALACGTPVLTFNTGGSPEIIDETCGEIIYSMSIDETIEKIRRIKEEHPFAKEDCVKRASSMDRTAKFREYIDLYKQLQEGVY